jgi:hypothetical protein
MDGLTRDKGQERLHQFVRSLEALILPDRGATMRQFINRCQTFALASAGAAQALREAFEMRSDTEHLHDWNRALTVYPVADRDDVAWQRTRQLERLATFAYSHILERAGLRDSFQTEGDQQRFWKLDEAARLAAWGDQFDLESEPFVTRYDQWSRAVM